MTNRKICHFSYGRAEDKPFELLLASIADYFFDNPAPAWSRQLREARSRQLPKVYAF